MMILNHNYAQPEYFWLLAAIPLLILWYWYKEKKGRPTVRLSTTSPFGKRSSLRVYLRHSVFLLRLIGLGFIIVALARPQSSSKEQNITSEGIDIILSMDISTSMLAQDLKPNRVEAAKKVAEAFVDSRPNDRMGLVVFAGESFTQCPLTTDHSVLKNLFGIIKTGQIKDGTALGEGLATAVNRIKDSKAKSKVVILLTDGVNNAGAIAPLTAAEIAETFKVRVYTIGVGTQGMAPYPFQTPFGVQLQNVPVDIDEATLSKVAKITGGKYFRATNNKKLKMIYDEIDKLEKTKIEVSEFRKYKEEYLPYAIIAGLVLLFELLLRYTVFRSFP
jgi:Ca-activated chloride channel family protein